MGLADQCFYSNSLYTGCGQTSNIFVMHITCKKKRKKKGGGAESM